MFEIQPYGHPSPSAHRNMMTHSSSSMLTPILCQYVIGLFDESGKLLGSSSSPIQIWKDGAHVEGMYLG
ncbi:FGGY carbohydrate kinase domain-containing protein [Senna tora]|uniref:FGGY carbohydrate kinase domain-containing protein n=1 Tax=Senna tora TaxID=362788 RepID=A0A834SDY7_9FABA|nr:FGGY carbohydrate kinase domain-containing protein [Senna tora]